MTAETRRRARLRRTAGAAAGAPPLGVALARALVEYAAEKTEYVAPIPTGGTDEDLERASAA